MEFASGERIDGCYSVREIFRGGGMGLVYRALHEHWNIEVAIKHPRNEFLRSNRQTDSFHKECATWASIGLDPYIATCYYSKMISKLPCVVSEFMSGGSLQDSIQKRLLYRGDESEALSRMLAIAASTAWGLSRAHQSSLLHCDVKPGNMLLTEYGTAKIADFGLAVAYRPSLRGVKAAGLTVPFASPEQSRGLPLTPATDVWSWAASMLAMFMGGVTWESGSACGAVLRDYVNDGGKSYRIPAMPESFASLLLECFHFSFDARLADFSLIANRVCDIYQETYGEACPAGKADLELISADSLNNRAVSRYDIGDLSEVHRLLEDALIVDPLHPEANFNAALLAYRLNGQFPPVFIEQLLLSTKYDLGEFRPWSYLACLFKLKRDEKAADEHLKKAYHLAEDRCIEQIQRLWENCLASQLTPILAPPISGEDLAYDSERFHRLMNKAQMAIDEHRYDDAQRYLLMSGDISGFARHPQRRRLLKIIPQS